MLEPPQVPRYGEGSLSDLLPSVLATVGVPGCQDVLGLPAAHAICVLLVDGLGWEGLRAHAEQAPFLNSAPGRPITSGFPSTTAVSLGCLGTGLPPGEHGVIGYQTLIPGKGRLMHSLRWDAEVDPLTWQPHRTAFECATAHGVAATQVAEGRFEGSGLTVAALRGTRYVAAGTFGEVAAGIVEALGAGEPSVVYAYVGDLDFTGHHLGVDSLAWRVQLAQVDRLVEQVTAALPAGTALIVTGDHGMVDVPRSAMVDVDAPGEATLRKGVQLLGGEPRARYVYARPGAADDVLAAWQERLGDSMWVLARDEAVQAGWFGPVVSDQVLPRIGDVVAAARTTVAVVATAGHPREAQLVGHHGSLTPAEQLVPLLAFG